MRLTGDPESWKRVASVHYQARYRGYDENGNGWQTDWHGMTKGRVPYGMLGASSEPPFVSVWDTRLIPAQEGVALRAFITFKGDPALLYQSPVQGGIRIPGRDKVHVSLHPTVSLPKPFWSRDGKRHSCAIDLTVDPERIESAALHVVAWTGGAGDVADYFTLNGHPLPVAEGNDHELVYSVLPVDPDLLKRGGNTLELHSDTTHHGIEIMKPGPALVVRARK